MAANFYMVVWRREARKSSMTKASDVRFATWSINRSTMGNYTEAIGTTTMGWSTTFRWDRDLGETEEETDHNTSMNLSNTVNLNARVQLSDIQDKHTTNDSQIGRQLYADVDDIQKQTWHFQGVKSIVPLHVYRIQNSHAGN
ncbi:hypothetical protein H0H87_003753 [Tephrocybe sp. NHM501043]|nr:hypothetical protein H0H87_003753 [Tephrocybe sp. NHM501043]